jgi:TPP-dependent pyruvate/acetoin dehydrogenase alpha subunit
MPKNEERLAEEGWLEETDLEKIREIVRKEIREAFKDVLQWMAAEFQEIAQLQTLADEKKAGEKDG